MMQCNLRLATRRNGQRDGELMLVSPSGERWAPAGAPTPTLQALLDQWAHQAWDWITDTVTTLQGKLS